MKTRAQYTFEKLAFDTQDAALAAGGTLALGGAGYGGYKAYQGHQAAQQAAQQAAKLRRAGKIGAGAAAGLGLLGAAGYGGLQGLRHVGGGSGRAGADFVTEAVTNAFKGTGQQARASAAEQYGKAQKAFEELLARAKAYGKGDDFDISDLNLGL